MYRRKLVKLVQQVNDNCTKLEQLVEEIKGQVVFEGFDDCPELVMIDAWTVKWMWHGYVMDLEQALECLEDKGCMTPDDFVEKF